jgi:hypothetical protein
MGEADQGKALLCPAERPEAKPKSRAGKRGASMGSGSRAAAEAPRAATRWAGVRNKRRQFTHNATLRARAGQRVFCAAHNS